MAINILTQPIDPPVSNADNTNHLVITNAGQVPDLSGQTLWEDTASVPAFKQGAYIPHLGNTFQVQGGDEAISGSPSAGLNYIIATETSGVITLAWATSISGYAYNQAYGGIYNGSNQQVLRDVCYLDGTDYIRGWANGMDFNTYILANGDMYRLGSVNALDREEATDLVLSVGNTTIPAGYWVFPFKSGTAGFQVYYERYNGSAWEIISRASSSSIIGIGYSVVFSDGVNYRFRCVLSSGSGSLTYRSVRVL